MSAPLADVPRVEIGGARDQADLVTLGRALSDDEFADLVFCAVHPDRRCEVLVGLELDRAGLTKLRDACNALLGESH